MKKLYNICIVLVSILLLTSCSSSYSRYWHEEEDDVYFTSKTKEEVEAYKSFCENSDNDDNWNYEKQYPRNDRRDNSYRRYRENPVYTPTPSIPRSPRTNGGIKAPTPTRKTTPTTPTKKDNSINN